MAFTKHLPNVFTILNLLTGCFSIMAVFQDNIKTAAFLIILGGFFDFLDGFFARLFHVGSPMGKELDSFADLITFGLAPAFLMYFLMKLETSGYYPLLAFLLVAASAFRLAKFNLDPRQEEDFIGLPTPANAFLVVGLVFIYEAEWQPFYFLYSNPHLIATMIIIQSFLLNVNMRFFSMKFKGLYWKDNRYRYLLTIAGLLFFIIFYLPGIFLIILSYIILAIIYHFSRLNLSRQ